MQHTLSEQIKAIQNARKFIILFKEKLLSPDGDTLAKQEAEVLDAGLNDAGATLAALQICSSPDKIDASLSCEEIVMFNAIRFLKSVNKADEEAKRKTIIEDRNRSADEGAENKKGQA